MRAGYHSEWGVCVCTGLLVQHDMSPIVKKGEVRTWAASPQRSQMPPHVPQVRTIPDRHVRTFAARPLAPDRSELLHFRGLLLSVLIFTQQAHVDACYSERRGIGGKFKVRLVVRGEADRAGRRGRGTAADVAAGRRSLSPGARSARSSGTGRLSELRRLRSSGWWRGNALD